MIVFVVDGANRDEFATRFSSSFPKLSEQFRVVDYAALATAPTLPAATYVFLDLLHSTSGRKKLTKELAGCLYSEGCRVLGMFEGDPKQIGNEGAMKLPAVQRAEAPDGIAESAQLTSPSELCETWRDWVLQGTEPSLIHTWPTPSAPGADGLYRRRGLLQVDEVTLPLPSIVSRTWPGDESVIRLDPAKPDSFGLLAQEMRGALARVEYWTHEGEAQLWRRDDSAACLFRPPLDDIEVAGSIEQKLQALDVEYKKRVIPIQWAPLFAR